MIVSAHQPHYLPWIGYFNKIYLSDVFMIMDNMTYTNKGYINRNRIITKKGVQYLSVPLIKPHGINTKINELIIDNRAHSIWNEKHLRSLIHNYSKRIGFNDFFPIIENILMTKFEKFFDLQFDIIVSILSYLNIEVDIQLASTKNTSGCKEKDLFLNIINDSKCDKMLLGLGASNSYVDFDYIKLHGGKLVYQNFEHPLYPQKTKQFYKGVSIIDLLFNVEKSIATQLVKNSGTIKTEKL